MSYSRSDNLKLFSSLISELDKSNDYEVKKVDNDIHLISPKIQNKSKKKIAVSALTHGDEVVGLDILMEIILRLLEKKFTLKGDLYLIIANREAYLKDRRFVDVDLNRTYGLESYSDAIEEKRVQEIKPVLDQCDVILDLHQAMANTIHPFFFVEYTEELHDWLTKVTPNVPIVYVKSAGTVTTLSSYGRFKGKISATLEVGSVGVDYYQLEVGSNVAQSFIEASHSNINEFPVFHPLRKKAPAYAFSHWEPYEKGNVKFVRNFVNFEYVKKGEPIVLLDGKEIKSPKEGEILRLPHTWFEPGTYLKPDGIFAILQEGANPDDTIIFPKPRKE